MLAFDGKGDMADVTNAAEGSWYQPIKVQRRIRPHIYKNVIHPAVSGLGVEETQTGKGIILLVGIALLAGIFIVTR